MRIKEECYETETGTPTITMVLEDSEKMIPYVSFRDADKQGDCITVRFHDWIITITGKSLDNLWQQLQLQDVRVIRKSPLAVEGDCCITRMVVSCVED